MSDLDNSEPEYARVVAQRLRNNIMRELSHLAEGDDAVKPWGFSEYFEAFFDQVPYDGLHANEAMSADEIDALTAFWLQVRQACDATPPTMSDEDFIATGWPVRLAPMAAAALAVFDRRGLLDDEEIDLR